MHICTTNRLIYPWCRLLPSMGDQYEAVHIIVKILLTISQIADATALAFWSLARMLAGLVVLILLAKVLRRAAKASPEEALEILTKLLRLL